MLCLFYLKGGYESYLSSRAFDLSSEFKYTIETVEKDGLSLYPCLMNAHFLI